MSPSASVAQLAGVSARRAPGAAHGRGARREPRSSLRAPSRAARRRAARARVARRALAIARRRVVTRGEPRSSSGRQPRSRRPSRIRLAACVGDDLRHKSRPTRTASRTTARAVLSPFPIARAAAQLGAASRATRLAQLGAASLAVSLPQLRGASLAGAEEALGAASSPAVSRGREPFRNIKRNRLAPLHLACDSRDAGLGPKRGSGHTYKPRGGASPSRGSAARPAAVSCADRPGPRTHNPSCRSARMVNQRTEHARPPVLASIVCSARR